MESEQRLLRWVVRHVGIKDEYAFSDYLHECKESGDYGTKNERGDYTRDEMIAKAKEYKELYEADEEGDE